MEFPWAKLFKLAVDFLNDSLIPTTDWTFGGGSALFYYFYHRESKDVDIFLTDAQYLTWLTPRLNSLIAKSTEDYVESANFLKLQLTDGEIDFIIAPYFTADPYKKINLLGKEIQIETPWEIVLKKLFYRAQSLKVRDIVDVAVVYKNHRETLVRYAKGLGKKKEIIEKRFQNLIEIYPKEIENLKILDESLKVDALNILKKFLREI
ncbi:nucleotidyl transferase AbiEii/AbiGii toxin family protein [Carboxydothermus hydrogenoformans]|nr:nucleotidyl transferase AbiEii/AbiGii toxin family protein [Carboxydothermus hydrogenoformans]